MDDKRIFLESQTEDHTRDYHEMFLKMQTEPELTALSNAGHRERREVIENLSEELVEAERTIERLQRERDEAQEELKHLLADWNAVREASGSATNGGLVGHVRALRSERDEARADLAELVEAVKALKGTYRHHAIGSINTPMMWARVRDVLRKIESAALGGEGS